MQIDCVERIFYLMGDSRQKCQSGCIIAGKLLILYAKLLTLPVILLQVEIKDNSAYQADTSVCEDDINKNLYFRIKVCYIFGMQIGKNEYRCILRNLQK